MRISIVTPSFQQLHWLRLCAASVADQQFSGVEHLVQDAGSEGIEDFAAEMKRQTEGSGLDYRFQVVTENDAGMYDAINRGLRRAAGEICSYLNCDEQLLPGTLQKVDQFFSRHPEVEVLFGDAVLVDGSGRPLSYRRTILPEKWHTKYVHLGTLSCATFFRRSLVERGFLFDPQWKMIGDAVWVHRLLEAGVQMAVLNEPLAVFAFTGENLGQTAASQAEAGKWRGGFSPARLLVPWLILRHRFRKMAAGAYKTRELTIELHTLQSPGRRVRIGPVKAGYGWPKQESS
jgi:glycosyltransferase involved in cell wall biosynthesis